MRPALVLGSLLLVAATPVVLGARQPAAAPVDTASYTIAATLDPVNHLITARGRLTWRNASTAPATELRFHLYWNAWRDDETSWMREHALAGDRTLFGRSDDDRGSIDLTTL